MKQLNTQSSKFNMIIKSKKISLRIMKQLSVKLNMIMRKTGEGFNNMRYQVKAVFRVVLMNMRLNMKMRINKRI